MLEASGHTTGLSVQTGPRLCPPRSHQLPLLRSHKLGSVRAADCAPASSVRLEHPPTVLPGTPSAHIHLTLPFSVLPIYPNTLKQEEEKNCFPDCLAEA